MTEAGESNQIDVSERNDLRRFFWITISDEAEEVFYSIFWSSLPIVIGIILILAVKANKQPTFWEAIHSVLDSGELFIYSTTLLAPTFYWFFTPRKEIRGPWSLRGIGNGTMVIIFLSALFYGITKVAELVSGVAFYGSIILFGISCLLLHHSVKSRNKGYSASDILKERENSAVKKLKAHRASKKD